jgi:VHL beta domain
VSPSITTPDQCLLVHDPRMSARATRAALWLTGGLAVVSALAALPRDALAAGPTPDPSCARESSLRSLNDNTPAVVTFVNNTSETVQALWLNFSGHRVPYGKLAPGASYSQGTWITHPWIVADLGGTCLTLYVTSAKAATVVVSGPSPVPTPAATATVPTASPAPSAAVPTASPRSVAGIGGGSGPPPPVSFFGTSLASPASSFQSPVQFAATVVVVLLLIAFIPFPAELFNATYEANHARIKRWWTAHVPWLVNAYQVLHDEEGRTGRAASLAIVIVIGGVLGAGLDPGFGWNLHTLSLASSVGVALILCAAASGTAILVYRWRQGKGAHWHPHALPGGLAVTALGVLLSRLTNFEPGYLYGLILMASFAGAESPVEEGREVAVSSAALIVFSVACWGLWIPLQVTASQPGASGALVFLADLLTAVFVIGIVRAIVLLMPIRFLPGYKLVHWSRAMWALIFGLGAFAMAEIMILPESGSHIRSVAPLVTTLVLFVGFGVGSVGFWAYFRYTNGPAHE